MKRLLSNPRVRRHLKQGGAFILCGVLGVILEFTTLRILVGYYDITPFIAYAPSKILPILFVFFFNKYVTFRAASGDSKQHLRRFILVYSVAFVLGYALASGFYAIGLHFFHGLTVSSIDVTDDRIAYLANASAIALMAAVNYVLSQKFIFRKEKNLA